jgi:hypothetical protein
LKDAKRRKEERREEGGDEDGNAQKGEKAGLFLGQSLLLLPPLLPRLID